jgi:hypothetical protein
MPEPERGRKPPSRFHPIQGQLGRHVLGDLREFPPRLRSWDVRTELAGAGRQDRRTADI